MKHLARQPARKPPIKRLAIAFLLVLWLAATASSALGQQAIPPAMPAGKTSVPSDQLKRQEAFQIIWQTVNDQFYDAGFGGVDWAGARTRYQPLVARAASDREFHALTANAERAPPITLHSDSPRLHSGKFARRRNRKASVESIFEKYLVASGGKEAFEK